MSLSISSITLSFGRIAASMMGLASTVILARLFSREDYGTYRQIWLVYETFLPFLMMGLPASISYYVPQFEKREQKMALVQTGLLLMLAGLVLSGLSYVFAGQIARGLGNKELEDLFKAFFWFPVFTVPLLFIDTLLVATFKSKAAAGFNILSATVQFGSVVVPVLMGYGLEAVVYTLNFGAFLRFTASSVYLLRMYRDVPFNWSGRFIKEQLHYSVPLGLSSILGVLTQQLDRIIVAASLGAAEYAVYVNGAIELPFIGIIAGSVMTVITPEFVRLYRTAQNAEILRLWHSAICKVGILFLPLTAFLMAYSEDTVILLFSERYAESSLIFFIFLFLLPLRITTYGSILMAAGKSSIIFKAALGTVIINIILVFSLMNLLGLTGAALATVISVYIMAGWQLYKISQVINFSLKSIFPWRKLATIMLFSALSAVISLQLTGHVTHGLYRFCLGGLIFAFLYFIAVWFGGIRGEVKYLLGLFPWKSSAVSSIPTKE